MNLHNKNYVFFYESQGYSFFLEDLIIQYYCQWPLLVIGQGGGVKKYVPEETLLYLKEQGSRFSVEEIKHALLVIQEKMSALHESHANSIRLKDEVLAALNGVAELLAAYSLFDPSYSEGIYVEGVSDERATLIEESKNVIRDELDFVFFRTEGWLQSLLRRIAEAHGAVHGDDIHWYREDELVNLLNDGTVLDSLILEERKRAYIFDRNDSGNIIFIQGEEALAFAARFLEAPGEFRKTELKGAVAHGKGRVITGEVCIIYRDYSNHKKLIDDMAAMKEGSILVTNNTDPEFIPALKKAKAVITDLGGLLSHAAISARELDIPCVVGVGDATTFLKKGDAIQIDAATGIITLLK